MKTSFTQSVTEEAEELQEVLEKGVKTIVVSSFNGLVNLTNAATKTGTTPDVMIRVNPEVFLKAGVKASYRHGKFGVPFNTSTQDSATYMLRSILASPNLAFAGFHFHLGSQIEDPTCFVSAIDKLENFVNKMRRQYPELAVKVIDIGGGTPVFYGSPVPSLQEIAGLVSSRLNRLVSSLEVFKLVVESGRFLSAEACALISRIVNTKEYAGQKFVFVDSGYHLLLDSVLLNQEYPQEVIPRTEVHEDVKVNVAGRLCDTLDILPPAKLSDLAGSEAGKLMIFFNVGAYSIVFNMPFHCQTKPAVVMKRVDGEITLVRRLQTIEELFFEEGGNLDF